MKNESKTHTLVGGQVLIGVHSSKECATPYCAIHCFSDHHMVDWLQNWHPSKRMIERVCEHGIGHPDPDDLSFNDKNLKLHMCDGCCHG